MILHVNRLPADDSHEISCLFCYFWKSCKIFSCRLLQIVGGALRVKFYALAVYCKRFMKRFQDKSLDDFFLPKNVFWILKRTIYVVDEKIFNIFKLKQGCTGLKVLQFRGLSWKLNLPWKVLENHSKALKGPWILLFSVGLSTVDRGLNQYKIVVPLFGAAYAAPNIGTAILY